MNQELPHIEVRLVPQKYYNLYINGVKREFIYGHSKKFMERYLKKTYGIDLRTDPRISKNFKEYTTRLVRAENGVKHYVKKELNKK